MKTSVVIFGLLISIYSYPQKLVGFKFSQCLVNCVVKKSSIESLVVEKNRTKIVLRTFANCGGNFIGGVRILQDSLLDLTFEIRPTKIIDEDGKKQLVIEATLCDCPFDFTYEVKGVELQNPSLIRVNGLEISQLRGPLVEEVKVNLDKLDEDALNNPDQIFTIVEEQAKPIGGLAAFYQNVRKEIRYPEQAIQKSLEGRVFCEFVVNRDGSIQDVQIIRGIGAGCDEEAIRLIQASAPWTPAQQRGKIRSKFNLAIIFKLDQIKK